MGTPNTTNPEDYFKGSNGDDKKLSNNYSNLIRPLVHMPTMVLTINTEKILF